MPEGSSPLLYLYSTATTCLDATHVGVTDTPVQTSGEQLWN